MRHRRGLGLAAVLLAVLATTAAAPPRAADLEVHVQALTAPEMEGRGSGTPGGERAARYIASVLARAGLRPGGDGGTGAGVPVLFVHSGMHADYHQPSDTPDKLDLEGMARIAVMGARVAARIAEGPRPVFARVAPPPPAPRDPASDRRDGAFLGIAADIRAGSDGVRLDSVLPGSPAERAGLRAGDVLVRLADMSLDGFGALRGELGRRRPRETVRLVYLRDGTDHAISVTLGARP
jgi:S1-C subfamily serine protease